jgi:hypothetical protein
MQNAGVSSSVEAAVANSLEKMVKLLRASVGVSQLLLW